MKCAVWGANKSGVWLKTAIDLLDFDIKVRCFGDNDPALSGTMLDGLPISDCEGISRLYQKGEIEAVVIAIANRHIKAVAKQLGEYGVADIYMVPEWVYQKNWQELSCEDILIKIDSKKPRLEYFEYHIADHCNLNCKGCGHYCPLVTEPSFGDLSQYVKDLHRLKELCWGVHRIRLMGGEPLLNPQLKDFVIETRKVFPDCTLRIVTNAILLDSPEPELFEVMRENNCGFDITLYEPLKARLHKIEAVCDLYGVRYYINQSKGEFFKRLDISGDNPPEQSWQNCLSKSCAFLRDGKISTCAMPQMIPIFNSAFGTNITVSDGDVIDLYDEELDGWTLVNKLSSPMGICRYCVEEPETFLWEAVGHKVDINDWTVRMK